MKERESVSVCVCVCAREGGCLFVGGGRGAYTDRKHGTPLTHHKT